MDSRGVIHYPQAVEELKARAALGDAEAAAKLADLVPIPDEHKSEVFGMNHEQRRRWHSQQRREARRAARRAARKTR